MRILEQWRDFGLFLCLIIVAFPAGAAETPFDPFLGDGEMDAFELEDVTLSDRAGSEVAYAIAYTRWLPEGDGNGRAVLYNHGLQSHRGWFNATAQWLADRGFVVYAFDRIGSGTSSDGLSWQGGEIVGARGHVSDWRLFLDTIDEMLMRIRSEHPGVSVYLWGNSYGGKVVTAFLFERPGRLAELGVAGAVFTTPGNYSDPKKMPLPFSRMKLVASSALARFPSPITEQDGDNGAHWFVASDNEWFPRIRDDELSLRDATRSFWLQTRNMDRYNEGQRRDTVLSVPVSFHVVRNDPMMDNEKLADFARKHASNGWYKEYMGGPHQRHFLLFTEDREQALEDILAFLEGRGEEIEGAERLEGN